MVKRLSKIHPETGSDWGNENGIRIIILVLVEILIHFMEGRTHGFDIAVPIQ